MRISIETCDEGLLSIEDEAWPVLVSLVDLPRYRAEIRENDTNGSRLVYGHGYTDNGTKVVAGFHVVNGPGVDMHKETIRAIRRFAGLTKIKPATCRQLILKLGAKEID